MQLLSRPAGPEGCVFANVQGTGRGSGDFHGRPQYYESCVHSLWRNHGAAGLAGEEERHQYPARRRISSRASPQAGCREQEARREGKPLALRSAAQGDGDMLVNDDPAFRPLFKHHGPAAVQMRSGALLIRDVGTKSKRGPGQFAARMHAEVVVYLDFNAAVWLEEILLSAGAIFSPIVVFERRQVEVSQIRVRSVIRLNLRKIKGLPRCDNLGYKRPQFLFALLSSRLDGKQTSKTTRSQ